MLLHLHIPRTGGKSVVKWLWQLLPSQDAAYKFKNYQGFLNDVQGHGGKPCDFGQIKLITGHFYYGIDEYLGPHARYLVVLRDPVDRVKSLVRYIRKNRDHRLHELFASYDNIDLVYKNILHSPQFSNGQVRQLCGYDLAGVVRLNVAHADTAMSRITGSKVSVVTSDELSNFFDTNGRENLNRITVENSAEKNESCSWLDSDYVDAVIRENNELDIRLYEFCKLYRCTNVSALLPYIVD